MKDKYIDLIEQTFDFPQDEFTVEDNELNFHDIPLMELIKQYGTPLKITYLPKISQQINRAKRMFNVAMAKVDYKGTYNYCYCTKSSHFSFVLEEAMKNDIHLETSSAYDIHIINALYDSGVIDKDRYIICNGFKRPQYVENIAQLINDGFENTIPVIDNKEEIDLYDDAITKKCKIGIRIASEEEPKFEFYTSRLGIRYNDIINFYKTKIQKNKKFKLKMLHFFINTGIKDTAYYWNELSKCLNIYCELKAICPDLDSLNIGGGFPIKNSLDFSYDYEYLTEEIIAQIKNICTRNGIDEPHIFTEFGSFTVGESGATLYSIVNQKQQNDRENWYMIDSSFITTLPDTWGINQRYIMLAVIGGSAIGMTSLVFYVLVYMAANLAVFGIISTIEQHSGGKVGLADYNGLYRTNPKLALMMTLALFSLAGIPPFAGFFSKFFIFAAAFKEGFHLLVFIALLNTVISLYYYLLVVKAMFITPGEHPVPTFRSDRGTRLSLALCTAGVLLLGIASVVYDSIGAFAFGM